jgi:hypothetical protein
MPIIDSNYSTLANIRTKIRRLTRTPSPNQLSDADINNYINNFVLYDFPEHLRLFDLRTTLTFYTQPNIDTYSTNTTNPNDPLYNFLNQYLTMQGPVYIAGYQAFFSQSREQFFAIYPNVSNIFNIGFGDGITTNFTGVINLTSPTQPPPPPNIEQNLGILKNDVTFSSVDVNGFGLVLKDVPVPATPNIGNLIVPNNTGALRGTINYITGAYNITFPTAPNATTPIYVQYVLYQATLPQALLFYDGQFIVRPVPDQPYPINMEVFARPTALLLDTDIPGLSEWWQYIAYGASKKIFEDRMDTDSVAQIVPEFKQQERLILRRTLVQNSNQRAATIYTEQTGITNGGFVWGYGGGSF